ncbi:MAG: hypothetical protein SGI77_00365 [Pirellulaceae bacterium]|nr:hypothetical protein [Pirellulaceae bacterium]
MKRSATPLLLSLLAIIGWFAVALRSVSAQTLPTPAINNHPGQELFFAVAGEPFGVASMAIPVGVVEEGRLPRVLVSDNDGRIFYPEFNLEEMPPPLATAATTGPPPRRFGKGGLVDRLKNAIDNASQQIHPPSLLRVQFLFRGTAPLTVQLSGDLQKTISVTPRPFEAIVHRGLIESWWKGYTEQARLQLASGDYQPGIETYLTTMLASRLELPEIDLRTKKEIQKSEKEGPQSTIALLAGTDAMRETIMRETMQHPDRDKQQARVAIPSPPTWIEQSVPPSALDLEIESIATRVPPECFYLRFGKFSNSLWFQELTKGQGDGLAQMVMKRGLDYQANQRLERMLNTKSTVLAKLFGDHLISDMAIIGTDLFVQEGPAIGMLFEASNLELLRSNLVSEREATANRLASEGVRIEALTIDNHEVTLLASNDQRIRSFMVVHDKYILITTSRYLVRRFLAVGHDQNALSAQPVFRFMRSVMPIRNNYDVFAFFSPEFFRNLVSPQYQIELRRRLHAIANLQLADMATLAAKSEGVRSDSLEDLMKARMLPPWFLENGDNSQPLRSSNGWMDSLRGGRGSFIPIPDIELNDCSPEEAKRYAAQADFYAKSWPQTDPLVIGVRRFEDQERKDVERITLEAYVAPFRKEKYGWLSLFLAPPVHSQIQLPPDDIFSIQAHLSGQSLLSRVPMPDHFMFMGVKDMTPPPPDDSSRLLDTLRTLQETPAYIGAWPLPGYLDRLPFGLGGGPPDAFGFSRLLIGAWRWTAGGFSVLSFDRSILENCMLHLRAIPADDPSQVRMRISDLENSKVSSWVNTYWYRRALEASRGNALLMDTIQSQFKVPADQAKVVAERFLDGKLACPLGGEYQRTGSGRPNDASASSSEQIWYSSAWPNANRRQPQVGSNAPEMGLAMNPSQAFPPADYRAPWLGWFRGARVHLTQLPQQLILLGDIRLQKLTVPKVDNELPTALPSMNFDLFTAPFKYFGSSEEPPAEKSKERRDF